MTEEQERAIERCNKLIETKHSNWIGISNQKAIETVLNMLKEKDAEIKNKDKIIYLLVNKLNQDCKVFENGEIKEIVEIYEKIKSTSDLRGIELRKECIKQYFERKVEDE